MDQELVSLSQTSADVLYAIAFKLYQNGKYSESKQFFHLLTLNDPLERKYWMGLAASYQMLKEFGKAIEFYSIAALQDATDPYVHMHAADCFFANGQRDQGFKALDSAEYVAKKSEKHKPLISQLELIRKAWFNKKLK